MQEESKIAKDLERLKRQIRDGKKRMEESAKLAEKIGANIQAEMRARQNAKNKKKIK